MKKLPLYGYFGIILILVFWFLNWSLEGLRTHWGFFPLWLGYILVIDSLVFYRKGTSLINRNFPAFIGLFLISAPVWWLFELFNTVTQNWIYNGKEFFSDLEYALLASLSFSTVIPAVFSSAELAGTFKWINNSKISFKVEPSDKVLRIFVIIGLISLLLVFVIPEIFYPLIWIILFFLIEPLNAKLNFKTLLSYTKSGDWRPVISLWVGSIICAFFWEMWNYYSFPKWSYYLPHVNYLHIFEMPLPGYLGYLPFSLELYSIYHFITGLLSKQKLNNFIKIIP